MARSIWSDVYNGLNDQVRRTAQDLPHTLGFLAVSTYVLGVVDCGGRARDLVDIAVGLGCLALFSAFVDIARRFCDAFGRRK